MKAPTVSSINLDEKRILNEYTQLCIDHAKKLNNDSRFNIEENIRIYQIVENMLQLYLQKDKELQEIKETWRSHCNSN